MPAYDFTDEDGRAVELVMPMSQAVPIGETIEHEGRRLTRVVSAPALQPVWSPYVSDRLPRFAAGCRHTPEGKPIIETQRQEREVFARSGFTRE